MLRALTVLRIYPLIGEVLVQAVGVPMPPPVIALFMVTILRGY